MKLELEENLIDNNVDNNLQNDVNLEKENSIFNTVIEEEQNNFLNTMLGKTINTAIDIGLRAVLPDLIENQIIEVKNVMIKEGWQEGIKKAVDSAIDLGKSVIGIFTGKFEDISQVQTAVQKGGIIDSTSSLIDVVIKNATKNDLMENSTATLIRKGKNIILDNVSKNIENTLTSQIKSVEKIDKYSENWKNYYENRDFEGMEKEYIKLKSEIKNVVPIEKTITTAREIENVHKLIKNNGKNFDLSESELELAKKLV